MTTSQAAGAAAVLSANRCAGTRVTTQVCAPSCSPGVADTGSARAGRARSSAWLTGSIPGRGRPRPSGAAARSVRGARCGRPVREGQEPGARASATAERPAMATPRRQ